MAVGIAERSIAETPVAIVDFETTGLVAGADRVVEVSVVRVDPGGPPQLVFDTLVNPQRRVTATEIHGITDDDVANAPAFREIAGDLLNVIDGCVVAAYNVYFDIKFLNFEMANAGVHHEPPHICLMYMRPLLGLGSRCKLEIACQHHGVEYDPTHVAANDAMASGRLFEIYLRALDGNAIRTFSDLAQLRRYKFFTSFINAPFSGPSSYRLSASNRLWSRSGHVPHAAVDPTRVAIGRYWESLKTVVADLEITDEELQQVLTERRQLGLAKEQIRVLHARAFTSAMLQFCEDQWLDDKELLKLRRLRQCLSKLGWAPGE